MLVIDDDIETEIKRSVVGDGDKDEQLKDLRKKLERFEYQTYPEAVVTINEPETRVQMTKKVQDENYHDEDDTRTVTITRRNQYEDTRVIVRGKQKVDKDEQLKSIRERLGRFV